MASLNLWKVIGGPSVWKNKTGNLISIDSEWIVIRIKEIEIDEKEVSYDVHMPLVFCKEVTSNETKK